MAKITLLCATIIASVQCAVLNIGDVTHQRIVRSPCYTCGQQTNVPPPPPVVRTENWSGLARSADGLQNAVFSGAAAAADQGAQTAGEAFSLASSAVNGLETGLSGGHTSGYGTIGSSINAQTGIPSGTSGSDQLSKGANTNGGSVVGRYKESSYSYHNGGFKHDGGEGLQLTSNKDAGFGSASYKDQSGSINGGNKNIARSDYSGYDSGISNENHKVDGYHHFDTQQTQNSGFGVGSAGSQRDLGRYNTANVGGVDHNYELSGSVPASNNFRNQEGHYMSGSQRGYGSSSQSGSLPGYGQSGSENYSNGRGYSEYQHSRSHELQNGGSSFNSANIQSSSDAGQQLQTSGFGSSNYGKYGAGNLHESENSGEDRSVQGSNTGLQAGVAGSASIDAQSALSGALNLASQGLQTAHQSGCSTCGKSSYALSNAKSRTGSAVAVSVGG